MRAKGFDGVNYNQMKQTGDARELAAMQLYEMEAYEKGQNLHLQADPTTAEMMNKTASAVCLPAAFPHRTSDAATTLRKNARSAGPFTYALPERAARMIPMTW